MAVERHHTHDEPVHERRTSTLLSDPYGYAMMLLVAVGIFYTVVGAIGLARLGLDDWTRQSTSVVGLEQTALLSLIHLGIGLLALLGATAPRSTAMFLGAALIAFGIIAFIESIDEFAWDGANAAAYLITGVLLALAAALGSVRRVRTETY